jgi:Flp pilus assembly protein TadD
LDFALRALTEADRLQPNQPETQQELKKAREEQAAEQRRQEEQRREAEFARLLALGKTQLDGKELESAAREIAAALKLKPADPDAKTLEQEIQKQIEAAQAKRKAEEDQKQREVQQILALARVALGARDLPAAEKELAKATAKAPNDPNVQTVKQALDKAKEAERAAAEAPKKREMEHQQLVTAAQQAIDAKRFGEAIRYLTKAGTLKSDDPRTAELLKQAERGEELAKQAADRAREKAAEEAQQKKAREFQDLLKNGKDALAGDRFDEALRLFKQAGKLQPEDASIEPLIAKAEAGKEAARIAAEERRRRLEEEQALARAEQEKAQQRLKEAEQKRQRALYGVHLETGRTAFKAKRYAEAIKSFTAALTAIPKDKVATSLLKDAQAALKAEEDAKLEEAKKNAIGSKPPMKP